jgi:hypothetical protein
MEIPGSPLSVKLQWNAREMPVANAACQLARVHAAPNAPGSTLTRQWRLTNAPNSWSSCGHSNSA